MTVVAIIGILTSIGTVSYTSVRMSARDTKRVSDIKAVREAVELYFESHGAYPSDNTAGQAGLVLGNDNSLILSDAGFGSKSVGMVYMQRIPRNPEPGGTPYTYRSLNRDGTDCSLPPCYSYALLFTLEKASGAYLPGPHALTPQGIVGAEGGTGVAGVTGAGGIIYGLQNLPEAFVGFAETTVSEVADIAKRDEIKRITEYAVAPAIAAAAVANAAVAAQATTAAGSTQYILFFLTQPILAIKRRRRRQWGTVYNSLSRLPEDLAIVRLRRAEANRVYKSEITDKDGRFSFIVPEGRYRIEVSKLKFQFPSQITKQFQEQSQYVDLYHGQELSVGPEGGVLTPNVPIDPAGGEEAEVDDRTLIRRDRLRRFQRGFAVVGPMLGGVSLLIKPSVLVGLLFALQVVMYLYFRRFAMPDNPKNWGIIFEETTGRPIISAVVRIFALPYHKLLETRVTDVRGRYNFRVGNGKYYVTVTRNGYLKTETDPVDFTDATEPMFIASDIPLRRSGLYAAPAKPAVPAPAAVAKPTAVSVLDSTSASASPASAATAPGSGQPAVPLNALDQLVARQQNKLNGLNGAKTAATEDVAATPVPASAPAAPAETPTEPPVAASAAPAALPPSAPSAATPAEQPTTAATEVKPAPAQPETPAPPPPRGYVDQP